MTWMNAHEIASAAGRFQHDDVLGPATMSLVNLAAWTNQNSDGWHSWSKPSRAASKLMDLIERAVCADRIGKEHGITHADVRRALAPIKAFRTRMANAGMDADFDLYERFSAPTTSAAERTVTFPGDDEPAPVQTYSLAEVRNGTGWPQGVRFAVVRD